MKLTRIVVVLLLLPLFGWAGTFIETFNDDDLEDWQELVRLDKAPGVWEVVDDELQTVSREKFVRLLTTGDSTWKDYTVEFDVKPLNKHGIGAITIAARVQGTWVVLCSIEDPVEFVEGKPPRQREQISCVYGDFHDVIFVRLHAAPHPLLKLNKWAHLKLSVHNNIFSFSVNEKQVMGPAKMPNLIGVPDFGHFPDFRTGGVGFGIANYTARFDNITITGDSVPNKGALPVTQKDKLAITWGQLKQF
ncbi:DUF1080 domain-containing protein [Candidatus Poribacteria bacterium]|nr:DUF1080 domain-containing protein [Candidatus Poribacteria bacterium]MYK92693.1 DUF1080 domain-containing protein [Candidatus Poribacteria bacterium]